MIKKKQKQKKKKKKKKKTLEPLGKEKGPRKEAIFVVQKHRARKLHYDLRLEMKGTLKSWALPKGPSLNPQDKRLAVQVEDHPLDYADFEGEIAEGNYGAGQVIVWDRGSLEILKKESALIEFITYGQKLRGEWALIKFRGQEKNWLLVKKNDEFARRGIDITEEAPKSVISGKDV